MSAWVKLSCQARTWRNSRSIRFTSRLPKTPVARAQWMFRNVESLVNCEERCQKTGSALGSVEEHTFEATMRAPRNTRSQAQSSVSMWRCGLARVIYTSVARRTGIFTEARRMTSQTKRLKGTRLLPNEVLFQAVDWYPKAVSIALMVVSEI